MASSSKSSDVFRPRLPADPYAFERPWLVPTAAVDALLSDKFLSRQVILVLGGASITAVRLLLVHM